MHEPCTVPSENEIGAIYFNYSKTISILNWNHFSGKFHTFQYNKRINNIFNAKTT